MKQLTAVFVSAILLLSKTGATQDALIIRAGSVSSTPKVSPTFGDQTARNGFFAALAFQARLTDFFSFQPELQFVQKGEQRSGFGVTYSSRINYLEIPLLVKFEVPAKKAIAYFNGGPFLGIGLNGTQTGGISGLTGNLTSTRDVEFGNGSDELAAFDLGAQFGGGVGYKIGKGAIMADVRYGLGLVSMSNASNGNYKSRALMLALGFSLPL